MLSGQGVNTYKISTIVDFPCSGYGNGQGVNTYKISTIVDYDDQIAKAQRV